MTTRRRLLAVTAAAGAAGFIGAGRAAASARTATAAGPGLSGAGGAAATGPSRAGRGAPPRLTLPPPGGPHPVGTVDVHLVDRARLDPLAGPGRHRELMASVWYPATSEARRYPVAAWLPPAATRELLASADFDADAVSTPFTAGHLGAPALRGRRPVIMYSHGNDSHRSEATIVVQELASHGYVVVTVDTTFDAYSEFPDGRLTLPSEEVGFTPWDHAADVRFVLDRLGDVAAGRNPDAGRRPLPAGLGAALDLDRVGMAGWSKGATATVLVMNTDPRVRAGLAIDGPMQSVPPPTDLDRPLMLMTAENSRVREPSVEDYWRYHLHGWRLNVQADGVEHGSYIDHQWLIPQIARITGMSDEELRSWIGTLDPVRALKIQRAYPLAFFDRHLRGMRRRILEGPTREFPEMRYLP